MSQSRKVPTHRLQSNLVEAQRWLASGQPAFANTLLQPVLDDLQLRPEALYLSAVAALMDKRVEAALRCARAAVAARPDVARYAFVMGRHGR